MRLRAAGILALLCCAAGASADYVGARACEACHRAQFKLHSASGHARALARASEIPAGKQQALTRAPRFRYSFFQKEGQLRVRASDGTEVMDIPVEWAFGAGAQAITYATRVNEEWYLEHYFTYYSASNSMGATPGQEAIEAKDLAVAMGLLYKTLDPQAGIIGCFECHSTGPVEVAAGNELRPRELGVRCEACHGEGGAHVKAAGRTPMRNPRRMSAAELNDFCGRCHRPPASKGVEIDWNYAWNVRHQPVYFAQSACFRQSAGRFSCLTCHDPHGPLRRNDAAYYDSKCHVCHSAEERPPKPLCRANCVDCHMPRVVPQSALRFTNHWIGVYGEGAKLRPLHSTQRSVGRTRHAVHENR